MKIGIDGQGGLKLIFGTRALGTAFRTRRDGKVIFLVFWDFFLKKKKN